MAKAVKASSVLLIVVLVVGIAYARIPEYPQFELFAIDGENYKSRDLRGRAVLIPFFARVCPPCKAEVPFLNRIHEKYPDTLTVLSIAFMENNFERLMGLIRAWGIKYPVCADPDGSVARAFGVIVYPHLILYDQRGRFVVNYGGLEEKQNRELVKRIEALRKPIMEYRRTGPNFFIQTLIETDFGSKGLGVAWRNKITSWMAKENIAIALSMQKADYVIEGSVRRTPDNVEIELMVKSRAGVIETKFNEKVAGGKETKFRTILLKKLEIFPYLAGKK